MTKAIKNSGNTNHIPGEITNFDQHSYSPVSDNQVKITYPSADFIWQLMQVLDSRDITQFRSDLQREHAPVGKTENRVPLLTEYAHSDRCINIKEQLKACLKQTASQEKITAFMNKPTFEAFMVLDVAGLPKPGSSIFTSTATANSCNDDELGTALDILGWHDPALNITYQRTSTCQENNLTGVSCLPPKNTPVRYNAALPLTQWPNLSRSLALQFLEITQNGHATSLPSAMPSQPLPPISIKPEFQKYDHIYHWGCISQSWLKNALGHRVSSWEYHEEWNIIMTMAMIWHAITTLKPGGQLCLKTRIFKRAETLGLTALISSLFDNVQFIDNPRQLCTFVSVVYNGMTNSLKDRQHVADLIWNAMSQDPADIFINDVMQTNKRCKETLAQCSLQRTSMIHRRSEVNTVFLLSLYCLKESLQGNPSLFEEKLKPELLKLFHDRHHLAEHFLQQCKDIGSHMAAEQRNHFLSVMNAEWVKDTV